jgi:hypothetical protein
MYQAAAAMHYDQGILHMQHDDLAHNKAAAREFKRALDFVQDFRDADLKYEVARQRGTKRVIILPMNNVSGVGQYGNLGEIISSKVVVNLSAHKPTMEFLYIITAEELRLAMQQSGIQENGPLSEYSARTVARQLNAHEIWTGSVTQVLNPSPTLSTSDPYTRTASIKVGTRTEQTESGKTKTVDVYEERSAVLRTSTSSHTLSIGGTYSMFTSLEGASPQVKEFRREHEEKLTWTTWVSGNEEVYKINQVVKNTPAPIGNRVNILLSEIAQSITIELSSSVVNAEIPLVRSIYP